MDRPPGCPSSTETVTVIGGGASGTLAAIHLLSSGRPLHVVVVDRDDRLGAGVAYRTTEAMHLLNAPSAEMSAWSERPEDFVAFATSRGYPEDGGAYLPRSLYRDYLLATLSDVRRRRSSTASADFLVEEAVGIAPERHTGRLLVGLSRGSHLETDHVVLAVGPPKSSDPWGTFTTDWYPTRIADPWAPAALDVVQPDHTVVLVGSGLTMVDMVMSLRARGHRGPLRARSRHGLLPLHQLVRPVPTIPVNLDPTTKTARELVAAVCVAAEKATFAGEDWRSVIAGVRTQLPTLWQQLPTVEQRRLLRHASRYWEIHRHRMAPQIHEALAEMLYSGRLEVRAGLLVGLKTEANRHFVGFAGNGHIEQLAADVVINCTGPDRGYAASSPLIRHLLRDGFAMSDPNGLGLAVDELGDLCDIGGIPNPQVHTLGWLRRGRSYESTAVPEIRVQAEALGRRLSERPI